MDPTTSTTGSTTGDDYKSQPLFLDKYADLLPKIKRTESMTKEDVNIGSRFCQS